MVAVQRYPVAMPTPPGPGDAELADRLDRARREFADLEAQLADPATAADPGLLRRVTARYRELEPLVAAMVRRDALGADIQAATELIGGADGDEAEELRAEVESATASVAGIEAEIRDLLVPPDPDAGRAVIMEIRGAEGGEEANLFAGDLAAMYRSFATRSGWQIEVLAHDPSDLGGINHTTMVIRGADAWRRLKYEAGPHRVQRVPVTESQGRIHTSSATVAILPEADEVDIAIDERDLQIDVYRASGPGGQSVNTTDSAVRITHVPTGVVVAMQDERSQLQNRQRAMQVLRSRLYQLARDERDARLSAERRSQVGGGGRSEKIRTYNFKEKRVTDHRIGLSLYRLDDIMAGDLDELVDALVLDERTRLLTESIS
jgi:peptide chain release factor 1